MRCLRRSPGSRDLLGHSSCASELDIGNARTALLGSFTGSEPMFDAAEAARLLVAVAAMPAEVSVDQVTVTAAGMPYLGRG